jgi:hypothetical protein
MRIQFARQILMVRYATLTGLLYVGGCAVHGGEPAHSLPGPLDPVPGIDSTRSQTSFVLSAPSFQLVSTSSTGLELTGNVLRSTASAFTRLFGKEPPEIGVMAYDATEAGSARRLPAPSKDMLTVTLAAPGLTSPERMTPDARASLRDAVAVAVANAWLGESAMLVGEKLEREGYLPQSADGTPIDEPNVLPDWFHAAVVHIIADSGAEARARSDMRARLLDAMPLTELFGHRVPAGVRSELFEQLAAPDPRDTSRSPLATDRDVWKLEQARVFVAQATSVLHYLRETQGDSAMVDILIASVAGADMREILTKLSTPTTPEALDNDWRQWVNRADDRQVSPSAMRKVP